MEKRLKLKVLIADAQNGNQDAVVQLVVQLVHRFIPIVKKYSGRMGYEEADADLIAWFVNAVHKYRLVNDMELEILKQHLIFDKTY